MGRGGAPRPPLMPTIPPPHTPPTDHVNDLPLPGTVMPPSSPHLRGRAHSLPVNDVLPNGNVGRRGTNAGPRYSCSHRSWHGAWRGGGGRRHVALRGRRQWPHRCCRCRGLCCCCCRCSCSCLQRTLEDLRDLTGRGPFRAGGGRGTSRGGGEGGGGGGAGGGGDGGRGAEGGVGRGRGGGTGGGGGGQGGGQQPPQRGRRGKKGLPRKEVGGGESEKRVRGRGKGSTPGGGGGGV